MDFIENIAAFEPVSTLEIGKVKYSDREEINFTFQNFLLQSIIESTKDNYSILSNSDQKYSTYKLLYFDTPRNRFYIDAHNGKRNRFVVRYRQCIESNTTYFEVKYINKKGRKRKKKIKVAEIKNTLGEEELALLKKVMQKKKARKLQARLACDFKRTTLKAKQANDRVTIDGDIQFTYNNSDIHTLDLTLAKIRQERYTGASKFIKILRDHGVRRGQMSNYEQGMSIFASQKTNIYKENNNRINKIIESYD
ncbi:MAG TPA: VTC domain-containing protein [Bacteroidetes bacterium]|nr:MAG: hypothetical protein DRI54_03575 [Bacteroidota bacterium]HHE65343.1 VTC domain-containing protein [Bacteroidota bacterium]